MSTHFHPRPSTSAPQSLVRPGSSRLTIRAITPSPPRSLSRVVSQIHAQSNPYPASPGVIQQQFVRPRGEELPHARSHDIEDKETEPAHDTRMSYVGLQRGGVPHGRRSPVKWAGRSRSHRSRPYTSSPTKPSSRHRIPNQKDEVEGGGIKQNVPKQVQDSDYGGTCNDCPDTPTPMTASQKRSAYLPLGASIPMAYPKHLSHTRSNPNAIPTREKPAAIPEFESRPKASDNELDEPLEEDSTERRRNVDAYHSYIPFGNTADANGTTKVKGIQPYAKTIRFNSTSQAPASQADDMEPAPIQTHVQTSISGHATSYSVPRRPVPSSTPASASPAQHITSRSAASNISDGTARSQHSVFSTPGRDEMERKKALVEADEGPFGMVVSVAELNEARRVISNGGVEKNQSARGKGGDGGVGGKDGESGRLCEIKGCCSVM